MAVNRDGVLWVLAYAGSNCKIWLTNEHQHSGLRDDGEGVFERLLAMACGELEVPP